jgi:tetratricopeptide (TPR) repeat protein
VVLARDEAPALPRLLGGLDEFRGRGGEVLVVDTGSTDDTIDIARALGCRVRALGARFDTVLDAAHAEEIERRFAREAEGPLVTAGQRLFHFGDARQHAGLLASNPFVLQLDACDEVPALDVEALDRWIASGDAGRFEYHQHYGTAGLRIAGTVGLRIARFYDRTAYRWQGRVHEVLGPIAGADAAPTICCEPTQLLVRHHKDEGRPRHYLAGLALQVLERSEEPRWWHYLGRELFYHHWYRSAIVVLESHAAMDNAWAAERSQSLCFVGECLEALGRADEATAAYRRAFVLDPTRREPLLRLASTHCRRGEFGPAAEYASRSLAIPRTSAYPELEANYTWAPHSLLYWSLFWLGRRDEARAHWEAYRALAPEEALTREHARLFPAPTRAPRDATPTAAGRAASGVVKRSARDE